MAEDKNSKRKEWLNTLEGRRDEKQKSLNDLSEQIKKVKQKIHADEVKRLDGICLEKGMTYEDICNFLETVNMPLSEIIIRLNPRISRERFRNTDENNNDERNDEHE